MRAQVLAGKRTVLDIAVLADIPHMPVAADTAAAVAVAVAACTAVEAGDRSSEYCRTFAVAAAEERRSVLRTAGRMGTRVDAAGHFVVVLSEWVG